MALEVGRKVGKLAWKDIKSVWGGLRGLYNKPGITRGRTGAFSVVKFWIAPVFLALSLFLLAHPTFALLSDKDTRLSQALVSENIEVGTETVDGFSQIYYIFEGEKTFITAGSVNSRQPHTNGENIAYVSEIGGQGQVFLYHIPTGETVQITQTGTNLEPKVNRKGDVVWEKWIESTADQGQGSWQLFVYDGASIRQITQGDLAKNAHIEGDYIVYARKSAGGLWRSEAYSLLEKKAVDVDIGNETEYPTLENGTIFVGPPHEEQKRFPLEVSDLFVLDLPPLSERQTSEVSEQEILDEIENLTGEQSATTSAVPEATQSSETTP